MMITKKLLLLKLKLMLLNCSNQLNYLLSYAKVYNLELKMYTSKNNFKI